MYNKINRLVLYLLVAAAFILQLSVLDYIKIFHSKPDILAMLVIFCALFFGWSTALEAGFVCGLLKDIFSVSIFGCNTLTLTLTGLIAGVLSPKFFKESGITQTFLVFLFTFISMLIHYILVSFIANISYISLYEYMFHLIIPASIYTSVISAVVFPVLINKLQLRKQEEFL